jgi:tetratricopeptide (TPR) repeat protein
MSRLLAAGAVIAALISAPPADAQNAEDAWKNLLVQALAAAGAHDYPKAEQTLQKAFQEALRFGPEDPRLGTTLNSFGLVYRAEKKFSEADAFYRRALTILEKNYPADSIDIANVNFNIASVLFDQGHQIEALPFIRKTLAPYEKLLGSSSVKTAAALCMLGDALRLMKDFGEAEGPLRRCADIREANGGIRNTEFADALYSLALTLVGEGKFVLAEPRFTLAEKIRENTLGITNPLLAQTMEDHAALLKSMGRDREAGKLLVISAAIRRNQKKTN